MIACTLPLPNVGSPTIVARFWSCSAPATSSDALAVYWFDEHDARLAGERAAGVRLHLVDDLRRGAASCR